MVEGLPQKLVPFGAGVTLVPTAGVVFATKFIPNCPEPIELVAGVAPMAGIVFDPAVSVGPETVIAYPERALVEAASCELAVAVAVGENNWLKVILPLVAVVQSGILFVFTLIVPPVQKMRDSGMVPFSVICVEVLAATVPASVAAPVALLVAYVVMRT